MRQGAHAVPLAEREKSRPPGRRVRRADHGPMRFQPGMNQHFTLVDMSTKVNVEGCHINLKLMC
jgi:urease beta subunit